MFSSFFPWEFINNFPHLVKEGDFGLYSFSCFDPYIEKIFLSTVPSSYLNNEGWKVLSGEDFTAQWIENNLATLDFFSNEQSIKVLNAQNISADAQELLLQNDIEWGSRYCLLIFGKENKFYEKLKKKKVGHTMKIKEPRFWEMQKLLKFLCDQTGIRVHYDIQNFILESVPNQPKDFILALKNLALQGGDPTRLNIEQARKIISHTRLDQFDLARKWGEKKFKSFYEEVLNLQGDFDSMIQFFRFMQTHVTKMVDPSYVREKAKLSQYDKQIQAHSKIWTVGELRDELRFFGECEIEAKCRSVMLVHKIRTRLIQSF